VSRSERILAACLAPDASHLELVGALVAGLGHQLAAPLQYVGDSVAYVEARALGATPARREPATALADAVARIRDGLAEIDRTARALAALARLPAGVVTVPDVTALIRDVAVALGDELRDRVTLELVLAPVPPVRCAPGSLVRSLVHSGLSLAAAATGEAPVLTLRTLEAADCVEVRVDLTDAPSRRPSTIALQLPRAQPPAPSGYPPPRSSRS
jgi:signal transduction histidine kinase